jgi:hypothetical protein
MILPPLVFPGECMRRREREDVLCVCEIVKECVMGRECSCESK